MKMQDQRSRFEDYKIDGVAAALLIKSPKPFRISQTYPHRFALVIEEIVCSSGTQARVAGPQVLESGKK